MPGARRARARRSLTASRSGRPKGGPRGFDAGKRVSGRKRHLVVDTLGLAKLAGRLPRLWVIWADGGYAGALLAWALVAGGWVIELVPKPAGAGGFAVLPKRWIVERTFAWLGRCRRLSKDYEAWIRVAMIPSCSSGWRHNDASPTGS